MKTNIICSNYISGLRNQGKIDSKILSENLTEDQSDPEGEKWHIEIDGGVLEKHRKRMVLRIIRSGGRVKY